MPQPARVLPVTAALLFALTVLVPVASAQVRVGGGAGQQDRQIVSEFDADKDGRLNTAEREVAREALATQPGGRGGRGGRGGNRVPPSPGIRLASSDVRHYPDAPLYDPATLRTFFIEFENPEWEAELVAFNNTDVDVPATVTVDGRVYRDVGIHFRGNSSFGVGNGYKRSLNLAFDFVHEEQTIGGYRTLNFLNANTDPTLMRTVLSMHIARQYIAAPKANFVRVVINGENWGVYENAQQFNKEFVKDNFGTTKGMRWKIPQGGGTGGGFAYQGDDPGRYSRTFQIKSKDEPEAWAALIDLARTLDATPAESLEAALASRIDIDAYLRFLALDNAMVSGDAFFQRVADYSLYRHPDGRFHFVFHDTNEMFNMGRGTEMSPLVGQNDLTKPIIAKVLAVPSLRARYLGHVREIAEKSMDWNAIGPIVKQYRDLIADDVARDTRKLFSTEDFLHTTADDPAYGTLRNFFESRRTFLLRWLADNAAASSR